MDDEDPVTMLPKEQSGTEMELAVLRDQISQYAMALDLLATMSRSDTEDKAIENISGNLHLAVCPEKDLFFIADRGKIGADILFVGGAERSGCSNKGSHRLLDREQFMG